MDKRDMTLAETRNPASWLGKKLSSVRVKDGEKVTFVALPDELCVPIEDGCACKLCVANPKLARWDTLAVPTPVTDPKAPDYGFRYTWLVHYPELRPLAR